MKRGLSLIELVVVLSIIAILAALVPAVYRNFDDRAVVHSGIAMVKSLATALEMYNREHLHYPDPVSGQAGVVGAIGNYTNVTKLMRTFKDNDGGGPLDGLALIDLADPPGGTNQAVCVYAQLNNISPAYRVSYCLQTDGNPGRTNSGGQPACCFTDGGGSTPNCVPTNNVDWYPCTEEKDL